MTEEILEVDENGVVHGETIDQTIARLSAALDEARVTIARLEQAKIWQPIATAPADTQVWVWDDTRGVDTAVFVDDVWLITHDDAEIHPTHWMAQPEPPKGSR